MNFKETKVISIITKTQKLSELVFHSHLFRCSLLVLLAVMLLSAPLARAQQQAGSRADLKAALERGSTTMARHDGSPAFGAESWLHDLPVDESSVIIDYQRDYDLDLSVGGSYLYDSNTFLTSRSEVTSFTGVIDLGVAISSAKKSGRHFDYGLEYSGQYFLYESATTSGGRDPFEQRLAGYLGVNGSKTTIQVHGNAYDNNANSIDFSNFDHEVRRANSIDYEVGVTVIRELDHGSIEANGGWNYRDFGVSPTGQLNDIERLSGKLYWFYQPGWASKTDIGVGVGGGRDESENNFTQTYLEPGVQLRYRISEKSQAFAQVGYHMRDYDGEDSRSGSDDVVAVVGGLWNPRDSTQLRISANHTIQPSLASDQENYTSSGISAVLSQRLPAQLVLNATAAYDFSDYVATGTGRASGREDEFFRVGASVGRQFQLFDDVASSISLFYYLNENDSNLEDLDFVQHVAGIRMSVSY